MYDRGRLTGKTPLPECKSKKKSSRNAGDNRTEKQPNQVRKAERRFRRDAERDELM
jgi:hypothetical protein